MAAAPKFPQNRVDWRERGAAWLRPGVLFGAVMVPEGLVHAALGLDGPVECAGPLAVGLGGGPVFYSRRGFGRVGAYTALVPAAAGMSWRLAGSVAAASRALLLVPAPDVIGPRDEGPWWVVPPDRSGLLCPPDWLAALVALGCEASRKGVARPGGDDGA
jgi:hypothetical protein